MKVVISDFRILIKKEPLIVLILIFLLSGVYATLATYTVLMLVFYAFLNKKIKKNIDNIFGAICAYSFLYALFTLINGYYSGALGNVVFQSLYPPLFYLLGKRLAQVSPNSIFILLIIIVGMLAVPVISDVILDIKENQFINIKRQMEDEEGESSSATILGIYVSLAVSSVGVLFSKIDNSKEVIYKYIFLFLSFLGLMCTTHLLNRTGLVLACISVFCVICYNMKYYKTIKPLLIGVFFVLLFVSYFIDWEMVAKLTEAYDSRNETTSIGSAGGRVELWVRGFQDLFLKPLGSHASEKLRYAHNYWLDTARTGSTFSLLFLLYVTIRHVRNVFAVLKLLNVGLLRTLMITCNIGFFITCMVEPVMEGSMNFVFMFFLFIGMVSSIRVNSNNIKCC